MRKLRATAGLLAGLMFAGIAGCAPTVQSQSRDNGGFGSPEPYRQPDRRPGLSTKQKVVIVAGAAALYYLYKKHQDRKGHGAEGQYYRSKNGRIYYRDAKGRPVWVTPPQRLEVPADEYERTTGRSVDGYDGRVIREAPAGW